VAHEVRCAWVDDPDSFGSGKKCMPSWNMPDCIACSAALWLASGLNAGAPAMIGSPQAFTRCQL
jgi:hypothetical protein